MGSTLPKYIKTLERIQRQTARFCTQNYSREPGTVTQLLKDLKEKLKDVA